MFRRRHAACGLLLVSLVVNVPSNGRARADILAGNFLPNPSVEDDEDLDAIPDNWLLGGNDPSGDIWDTSSPVSGRYNLKLEDTGDANYTTWYTNVELPEETEELDFRWTWKYEFTSDNPSDEFRMTIAWRSQGQDIGYDHVVVREDQPDYLTEDWVFFVPLDSDALRLEFVTGGPQTETGVMHIDDISIAPHGFVPTTGLQPGDADQDLDFDQLDLVLVQIAAKYLTGQPATWGEGDWDSAPGGGPGNPPPGDRVFNQVDIIAALSAGKYLTGTYAAIGDRGTIGDSQTSLFYDPSTGELGVDTSAGTELTSINIDSAAGILTGDSAQNLGGSFDNDADANIFKATFGSSFGSLSFGNVAQAGLSADFVARDLTVIGSLAEGGDLGAVDLIYIPEPSTITLLGLALAGALVLRRRQWC